ncbi:MAG TPA: hypothetical protein VN914_10690 [Polyangia bacterium]|nr:hypothetical protein [Polyangia bacterium]
MRSGFALMLALAVGCATPDHYEPRLDGGGGAGADAGEGAADIPHPMQDTAPADVFSQPSPDAGSPDVASMADGPADSVPPLDERPPVDARPPSDSSQPADLPVAECIKCTGGSCAANRWDFDSGSLQGAKSGGSFAASPAVAMAPPFQGAQSLAMAIPVDFTGVGAGGSSYASFPICPETSSANLRTKTFRARVYLENGAQPATMPFNLQLYTEDMVEPIVNTFYPPGSWVLLEGQLPAAEDSSVTELQLWFGSATNPAWKGTVWVDDVRVE